MSIFEKKRRPPFVTLPRHKRGNAVIRLKGKIRRDAVEFGGRFTSEDGLNLSDGHDFRSQWFDFYFPGTSRFTLWNAVLVTARLAFWEAVHEKAFGQAYAAFNDSESDRGRAPFGGRTVREQVDFLEAKIIQENPPTIRESFSLDRSYVYGIGLHIVMDVDVIDRSVIETAIDRFFAIGETDWVSPGPVSRDRLPRVPYGAAIAAARK
jgi:hypothetical protein